MEFDWITAKQAAEAWSISDRRVQYLCANGQIAGVMRIGKSWLIPKETQKPPDGRSKNGLPGLSENDAEIEDLEG